MKSFVTVICLLAVILFLGVVTVNANDVRGVTESTITIGGLGDMTGPAASQALHVIRAWKTYTLHLNDHGGINGKRINLKLEDDRYSIPATIGGFKKLVFKDRILALLGPLVTGGIVALTPQVQKEKVPNIVPSSAEEVVNPYKRYVFNSGATYPDNMKIIFDYIMKKHENPRIGYVYPDNEAGKAGFRAVKERAEHYNVKIIAAEVLNFGAVDATSQVLNLRRKKADNIIILGIASHAACLLRSSLKFGLNVNFYGSTYTCDEDLIPLAGKAAEKFIGAQCFNSWYDDSPAMDKLRTYTLKYHPGTEKPYRPKAYVMGWAMSQIPGNAREQPCKNLNGETIVSALESLNGFNPGLGPPVTYGPERRKASDYQRLFKVDLAKGIFIPVTDWVRPGEL